MEGTGKPVFIGNDIGEDFPLESNAGISEDIDAENIPQPFIPDYPVWPSDELIGE